MGVGPFRVSGKSDVTVTVSSPPTTPNPNPFRYKILSSRTFHGWNSTFLMVEVKYLDCTTFEGHKILIYKNTMLNKIVTSEGLDPHFFEKGVSPIARFAPSDDGRSLAIRFCEAMTR